MFQCIKKMCFFGVGGGGLGGWNHVFPQKIFYFNSVFPILINFCKLCQKTIYLFISVYWIV